MKDYKLSEVKAMCEKNPDYCEGCELYENERCSILGLGNFADTDTSYFPEDWEIEEEEKV